MGDAVTQPKQQQDADSPEKTGRRILSRVSLCLKLATLHRLTNEAMAPPIRALLEVVNPVLEGGETISLQSVGENYFLNREIIKLDFSSYESAQTLRTIFKRLGANELTLSSGKLEEGELRSFLQTFQGHIQSKTPKEILKERGGKVALRAIGKVEQNALTTEIDERQNVLRAFALLALTIEQQLALLKSKRPLRLARLRKAVHGLADASLGHESLLVGLTRLDTFAGQLHFHLAHVTALTLLMCRRLGLARPLLSEACLAASFHDLARDDLEPHENEQDSAELNAALQRVPLRTIVRLCHQGLTAEALELVSVAHEHTLPADPKGPCSLGHLISVPCAFDRLTAPRPPRRGLLPDHAIRLILDKAGTRFDGRIVRLFCTVVGLYPVGTTVRLTTGETAIVIEVPSDAALFAKPRVKVIRTARGPADFMIDLSAPGEARAIAGSVDPAEEDVNVPRFLFA